MSCKCREKKLAAKERESKLELEAKEREKKLELEQALQKEKLELARNRGLLGNLSFSVVLLRPTLSL